MARGLLTERATIQGEFAVEGVRGAELRKVARCYGGDAAYAKGESTAVVPEEAIPNGRSS